MSKKEKAKAGSMFDKVVASMGLTEYAKLVGPLAPSKLASAKCGNCKEKADVYCVDCKKELCIFCTTLLHHPTTKFEKHSLEDIVKDDAARPEVKLISPILLELMVISGFVFAIFFSKGISRDYFSGESYCPTLGYVRYWIARFDANVFFFLKNELVQFCDWEDSYWRFFMDTWIRVVLTNTDSLMLLVFSFGKAFVVEEVVRAWVSPLVAYLYAFLAYFVRSVEYWVHNIFYEHFESQSHPVTKVLSRISRVVQSLRVADRLGFVDAKLTPPTHRRKRQATDVMEYLAYMWARRFRLLEFYRAQAQSVCKLLMRTSILVAASLRIICMTFSLSPLLDLPHSHRADRHIEWFTSMTGAPVSHEKAYYWSDRLVSMVLWGAYEKVLASIPFIPLYVSETAAAAWKSALNLPPVAFRVLIPVAFLGLARFTWCQFIKKQQAEFDTKWKSTYRKDIWGNMDRENPCGGVEYKKLKFSEHPPKVANGRRLERSNTTMT